MRHKNLYRFSHADAVSGGRVSGARSRRLKIGIFSIQPGSMEDIENRRKGGLVSGPERGRLNVESGQMEQMKALPQSIKARLTWATSEENKEACRKMGSLQGFKVDWEKVKTAESLRAGGLAGSPIALHNRWHVERKLVNLLCPLCIEAKERGEDIWWLSEYESTDKRNWTGRRKTKN